MIFIRQHGMTDRQSEWYGSATPDERDSFMLSAPVRIAAVPCVLKDGSDGWLYAPTIQGVPVGVRTMLLNAAEAQRVGEAWQARARARLGERLVPLDLAALGIQGEVVNEYGQPEGPELALSAERPASQEIKVNRIDA